MKNEKNYEKNTSPTLFDALILGGGAAGYFTAIQLAEKLPNARILIFEKNNQGLQKVKVSGGGRCNVTNQETNPSKLISFYPRGHDFLLEPFRRYGSQGTQEWFRKHGVALKTEADGRVFPASNTSQTILDLFHRLVHLHKIEVRTKTRVLDFRRDGNLWVVTTEEHRFHAQNLVITTGSDAQTWTLLESWAPIVKPVPSLFTFHIQDEGLRALTGTSFPMAQVYWPRYKKDARGPMLITHWGISGPAVLKLSAWAALEWAQNTYKGEIRVDWTGGTLAEWQTWWTFHQETNPKKTLANSPLVGYSQRFWHWILEKAQIPLFANYAEFGKKQRARLEECLANMPLLVEGKSTFKEEFVTAGGIDLQAIDPNTFSLKSEPSLYFAGEVLNIDAVTGGFNFQAAWTGGWHVAQSIAREGLRR